MPDFTTTPLQNWNRTSDEFRVVASTKSGPQTSSIGKFLYNLKAFFGMEPGMLKDLKSENIASVERFKNDINNFFVRRADKQAGKLSAYGQIHELATKQLDYLKTGGRRLSDRSIKQVMTHVSTLTDAVEQADKNLAKDYSPWVRNEAMQQIDMRGILKDAGALDENGTDMKRVLSEEEKSAINQGVATALRSLCSNVKDDLVRKNDDIWKQATSLRGLHALISDNPRCPIASFGLFGEQAKDQTFFREAYREVDDARNDFVGMWDQQPLDKGKVAGAVRSRLANLGDRWGSSRGVNGDFKRDHPELHSFVTYALAQEMQAVSPQDHEGKPTVQWKDAYENADWDHTLRDEKFVQFLTDRQIDRSTLSPEDKTKTKDLARDLFQKSATRLKDNDRNGGQKPEDFRGKGMLDSEYSRLLASHDEAKTLLHAAKNFGRDISQLDALRNTLIAMATRAEEGLRESVESCKTVIAEKTEEGITKYGKDVVDLVKANPDRLGFLLRDKRAPVVFEPGMVDRLIQSIGKGTDREKGDPETASACSKAWGLISRQSNDPTLGEKALNQKDAFTNFEKMETSRLIEVTDAHSRVVDQIQVTLNLVRERQKSLPSEAPRILHDSLTAFANALEQRLEDAAGPLQDARKELDSRQNKAKENAQTFEKRFGKPLTDLLKSQVGEAFEGIPKVGREHVESVATTARQTPGFAGVQKDSPGLIDRLVSHIGNAEQTDSLTGTTSDDLKVMTDSELDSVLDRSSRLSANLENDLSSIDEALKMLATATPSGEGPVANDKADNVLVSFLVAARAALTMQRDALGPVQQAASELAAGRGALSFAKLMPNLHKATSGTPRPLATASTSPSHVARSISNMVNQSSSSHGKTLSGAVLLGYRIRNAFATAQQNRDAWYKETETDESAQVLQESAEFKSFSVMVQTGEDEWKKACGQLESIVEKTKPNLVGFGGDPSTHNLASAILQDLQSIDFEKMRTFVKETLSSLARI
jgi:hypothetical protein